MLSVVAKDALKRARCFSSSSKVTSDRLLVGMHIPKVTRAFGTRCMIACGLITSVSVDDRLEIMDDMEGRRGEDFSYASVASMLMDLFSTSQDTIYAEEKRGKKKKTDLCVNAQYGFDCSEKCSCSETDKY